MFDDAKILHAPLSRARRPGLLARLLAWDDTFRQRSRLSRLTEAQRRDIGLSDGDIADELKRPVWDAPSHWKR